MTQMGTGKGTPETAWNYWKSASAFLVRYEVGAAWNTMGRELHENEVFIQGSRAERETGQTGVIFEHLDPAMPEARYHPRTFQYIPPFFFFLFQVELHFLSLVSGKGQTNKFNHLQIPRDP